MKRDRDQTWRQRLLLVGLLLMGGMAALSLHTHAADLDEANPNVTAIPGPDVEENGQQDEYTTDTSIATRGENVTDGVRVDSIIFEPPSPKEFKKFPNSTNYVDVVPPSFDGFATHIYDQSETHIQVAWTVVDVHPTADSWKLVAEGNLRSPSGGGSGSVPKFHWAAVVEPIDLQFLVPGSGGGAVVLAKDDLLPGSDPVPQVELDSVSTGQVTLSSGTMTVPLSGTVRCALADSVPGGAADITDLEVYLKTDDDVVKTVSVTWNTEANSLFRPYAGYGTFSSSVSFQTGSLDGGEEDIYTFDLGVRSVNAAGHEGLTTLTVMVEYDGTSASVTDVFVGDPLPDNSQPIVVEVIAAEGILDDLHTDLEGTLLDSGLDSQPWEIEKLPHSMGEIFTYGQDDLPAVFFLCNNADYAVQYRRIVDGFALAVPVMAEVTNTQTNQPATQDERAVGVGEVLLTHKSDRELNCPKTGDTVPMYAFAKLNLEDNGVKSYIPNGEAAPNPVPKVWDKRTYHHRLSQGPRYQWIDNLNTNPPAIANLPNGWTATYEWAEVEAVRAPRIRNGGTNREAHSGTNVRYPNVNVVSAGQGAGEFSASDIWNPTYKAAEGVRYFYCLVTIKNGAGRVVYTNGSFDAISANLGISMNEAKALVARRLHKVASGDYDGNSRTFEEWARVHIGTPYGYGAKEKLVNIDCSGLVIAALYAARPDMRQTIREASANVMAKRYKHGANGDPEQDGNAHLLFDAVADGTTKAQLVAADVRAGDLIGHIRWNRDDNKVTHIVIVEEVQKTDGVITSINCIEAQGYDDKTPERINFGSNAEKTVRHDYLTEYMDLIAVPNTNYIKKWYVIRPKPAP